MLGHVDPRLADLTSGLDEQGAALVTEAYRLATTAHDGVLRTQGNPYIDHPIAVALMVRDTFGFTDAETIAAALLHDTVEDTWVTREDVNAISPRVGELVNLLTDPRPHMSSPERRDHYLNIWPDAAGSAIKLSDRLCNLHDSLTMDREFAARYVTRTRVEMLWPGSPCLTDPRAARLLKDAVMQLDQYARTGVRTTGAELVS